MKLQSLPLAGFVAVECAAFASAQPADRAREWPILEDVLRTGEVVTVDDVGEGANKPLKVTLRKGDRTVDALWKPIKRGPREETWESYQAEIAAYEMDKMLMLHMVPPTVERDIKGLKGSLQLWLTGVRSFQKARAEAPSGVEWERTMARMNLFDNLISNWARTDRDFMVDSDWNVALIDHSQAFLSTRELSARPEQIPQLFDRRLVARLRSLQGEFLSMRFGRLLLEPQIRAILGRRDALLTLMEKLVAEKGEAAVLF
jgi:hypothetical protein